MSIHYEIDLFVKINKFWHDSLTRYNLKKNIVGWRLDTPGDQHPVGGELRRAQRVVRHWNARSELLGDVVGEPTTKEGEVFANANVQRHNDVQFRFGFSCNGSSVHEI